MVKVFVGNISPSTNKDELRELFGKFGEVFDCDIISNYGFVHMSSSNEASKAVAELNKCKLHGFSMSMEFANIRLCKTTKIHVGNLPAGVTAVKLRELFQEFGKVVGCNLVKNYAFVHMLRNKEALAAIEKLNHTELEGQTIFVSLSHSNPDKRALVNDFLPGPSYSTNPAMHMRWPFDYHSPPSRGRVYAPVLPPPPYSMRLHLQGSAYEQDMDGLSGPAPLPPALYDCNRLDGPLRRHPIASLYSSPLEHRGLTRCSYGRGQALLSNHRPLGQSRLESQPQYAPLTSSFARAGPPYYPRYADAARFYQERYS